jgi:FtsP/CotA-like multicopper oxidase with cupredoxin domain
MPRAIFVATALVGGGRIGAGVYNGYEDHMNRRDFMRLGWATVIATGAGKLRPAFAQSLALPRVSKPLPHPIVAIAGPTAHERAADFTLRIAPMTVELAPQVVLSTIGYSNQVPGPLLRVREGQPVAVEVVNDTDVPEYVHWHGLFVPSEVAGAEEEGTPPVPPHGRRRYQFVAKPAGSRWYHSQGRLGAERTRSPLCPLPPP